MQIIKVKINDHLRKYLKRPSIAAYLRLLKEVDSTETTHNFNPRSMCHIVDTGKDLLGRNTKAVIRIRLMAKMSVEVQHEVQTEPNRNDYWPREIATYEGYILPISLFFCEYKIKIEFE